MEVVYEDNHIIIVNKQSGEIVQGDKTGDPPLSVFVKDYIRKKYAKQGSVFLGVVHRLDRPVSGLVVFARTSKALTRLNRMFAEGEVHKTYWAIVKNAPQKAEGTLKHWLVRNEKHNRTYAYPAEKPNSKKAILTYRTLGHSDNYPPPPLRYFNLGHPQESPTGQKHGLPLRQPQSAGRGPHAGYRVLLACRI